MIFLVSTESYLVKWILDSLVPPKGLVDCLGIIFIAIAFVCLIASATLLFLSFRFESVNLLRPDDEVVTFFDIKDLPTIYRLYAIQFNREREANSKITEKKIWFRHRAYYTVLFSFLFLICTGVIYVIHSCSSKCSNSDGSWIFFLLD